MAILDQVLAQIVTTLAHEMELVGMRRQRGGIARGVAWAEASGRGPDGAWMELRIHHRPSEHRLDAGLLAYEPLSRGGRTIVVGEKSLSYRYEPSESTDILIDAIRDWLEAVAAHRLSITSISPN